MIYSRDYLVHYYEINNKKRLTLPTLIHYFEDIAILNSDAQGFSLDYFDRTNQGFMLIKWDITIHHWPKFKEIVTINTRPSSFKRFLANREYKAVDKDGNPIAEAQTLWIFADTKTRKPIRVPDTLYKGFDLTAEAEKSFVMLDELSAITNGSYSLKIKTQNLDIDTNDHVNNVRYVEWALESLPAEFLQNYVVSRIQVNYKKELQFGEEADLISEIKENEDKKVSLHSIYSSGKEICHLQLEWIKE